VTTDVDTVANVVRAALDGEPDAVTDKRRLCRNVPFISNSGVAHQKLSTLPDPEWP
jgi:hypothetical protein